MWKKNRDFTCLKWASQRQTCVVSFTPGCVVAAGATSEKRKCSRSEPQAEIA